MSLSVIPKYVLPDNDFEMLRLKKDISAQFISNVKDILNEDDINFTGDLSTSLSLVIINNEVSVETNNPYAPFVEFGLPAGHFVNFDALHDWVRIKLNVPDELSEEVTWKILKKIKNKKIKPKRFWKKSILRLVKKHGLRTSKRNKKPKHNKIFKKIHRFIRKNINRVI